MNDLIDRKEAIDAIVNTVSKVDDNKTLKDKYDGSAFRQLEIIEIIESMPPAQQWIPVSERLPDYEEKVLCWMACDDYIVGFRDNQYGLDVWITGVFASETFDVIAWQPLPEPFKEAE